MARKILGSIISMDLSVYGGSPLFLSGKIRASHEDGGYLFAYCFTVSHQFKTVEVDFTNIGVTQKRDTKYFEQPYSDESQYTKYIIPILFKYKIERVQA